MPDAADAQTLAAALVQARERTLDLVQDLDEDQLLGPRLDIVNPILWEIGHVGWFQERWVQRHLRGLEPLRADGDWLYDSARVPHDVRWDLPLPTRSQTLRFLEASLERSLAGLARDADRPEVAYVYRLATFHEDMHGEALAYTRQTHAYPAPRLRAAPGWAPPAGAAAPLPAPLVRGDVAFAGGPFALGGSPDEPFLFDNEKWAHDVFVAPFAMAPTAVTNEAFAAFVDDGGYRHRGHWSDEGWAWRLAASAEMPVYWRRGARGGCERREFDRWAPLVPDAAVVHVNAFEAEAYARWAGRRLPTEVEWEYAAAAGGCAGKRRFPWGGDAVSAGRANLEGARMGVASVHDYAAGDTPEGCRQLFGNVWEWTSTPFAPYPGFVPDPYKEYSQPWFDGRHAVLRGGCWITRSGLLRSTWRNFYTRDRRDVFAGFRTCAQ